MERFTYARTGTALRNQAFSLVLLAGADLAMALAGWWWLGQLHRVGIE